MNLNKLKNGKFDSMLGESLVLRYVKDEICHQMLVPSHEVDYKSQIGIDGKVHISRKLRNSTTNVQ